MPNVRFTFFRDPQDRKVFPGCFFPTLSILSGCYTWHFSEKSPRWEVRTTRRSVDPQNPIPPLTRSDRTGGWSSGGRCFLAEGLGPCQGIYCTFQLNPIESKNWRFPTKNQGLTPLTHPCFFFSHTKTIQRLWGSDGVSLHLGHLGLAAQVPEADWKGAPPNFGPWLSRGHPSSLVEHEVRWW